MFSSTLVFSFLALSVFAVPGRTVAVSAGGKCIKGKALCETIGNIQLQCYDFTDPLLPKPSETGICVTVVLTAGGVCRKDKAVCGGSLQCYEFPTDTRLPEPSKTGSGTCVNVVSNAGDKCTKGKAACGGSLQCYNLTDPLLPKLSEPGSRTGTCVIVVLTAGGKCIENQAVCGGSLQCYSNDTPTILSTNGNCKIVRKLKDKCNPNNNDVCQNDEDAKLECYSSLVSGGEKWRYGFPGYCTAVVSTLDQPCNEWSKCKNEGNPETASQCYANGQKTKGAGFCVNQTKKVGDQCSNIVKCANVESNPMYCKTLNGNGIGNCYSNSTLGQSCDAWSMCIEDSECYANGRLSKGAGTCVNQTNNVGDQCSNIVKCANDESTGFPMTCENKNFAGVGNCKTVSAPLGSVCINGKCNVDAQSLSCYACTKQTWSGWLPKDKDGNSGRCFGKGLITGAKCNYDSDCSVGLVCKEPLGYYQSPGIKICMPKVGKNLNEKCKNHIECGLGLFCDQQFKDHRCWFGDYLDSSLQ